jgi:hypothetical protein
VTIEGIEIMIGQAKEMRGLDPRIEGMLITRKRETAETPMEVGERGVQGMTPKNVTKKAMRRTVRRI